MRRIDCNSLRAVKRYLAEGKREDGSVVKRPHVDDQDDIGVTILMRTDNPIVAEYVLSIGADADLLNNYGESAWYMQWVNGLESVVNVLKRAFLNKVAIDCSREMSSPHVHIHEILKTLKATITISSVKLHLQRSKITGSERLSRTCMLIGTGYENVGHFKGYVAELIDIDMIVKRKFFAGVPRYERLKHMNDFGLGRTKKAAVQKLLSNIAGHAVFKSSVSEKPWLLPRKIILGDLDPEKLPSKIIMKEKRYEPNNNNIRKSPN